MDICPCGSQRAYDECCGPVIKGDRPAATAEQVMRARYSAYVKREIDYLLSSLHPRHRSDFDEKSTRKWAENSEWHKLDIVEASGGGAEDSEGTVEFIASFTESGIKKDHHELATFSKSEGNWYFVSGEAVAPKPVVRSTPKVGRNDPCPCGSGKKFKKCCGE
jgi:SEC-C motif-containing protein